LSAASDALGLAWYNEMIDYIATLSESERSDMSTAQRLQMYKEMAKPFFDILTPSGSIIMHAGPFAPSGYLLCNGAAVSRTTYADLFAVIGETFGPGDGSTTFNLPDFRGIFPRGSGTNDTLGSVGGSVGDYQDFAIENIMGQFAIRKRDTGDSVIYGSSGAFAITAGTLTNTVVKSTDTSIPDVITFDASTVVNTDSETRPANLSVNFIIKT
jgi:microcystin-dependent protein